MAVDILIIGAGGVGSVVAHKCAQASLDGAFGRITLASRTESRCKSIAESVKKRLGVDIATAQVDADNVPELCALIRAVKPFMVLNIALPYQDLHIMDACLECGVHYLDTANYEPPEKAK
ncbi:MAG: saccharopine dehydrogenase NADP-binding domain-containing protein, partial [Desulfovibrio sp.]|nr:saccharopine dehydrogenase NADP-binding domain-containing protein [Desulfovibrio sp.]